MNPDPYASHAAAFSFHIFETRSNFCFAARDGQEAALDLTVPSMQIFCHPTNDNLILTSSEDKCLRIWDVRTKRPAAVSQKFDYLSIGWNSDGSKIVGVREDARKYVDVLEIVDARTLEPEQCESVTEGSSVLSLAWSPTQPDTFFTVTNKSSSMLPFVTMVEMHQLTASGIVRRCAVPAHPEPCTDIDIQCDGVGKSLLTVSRDKDKDSDDRTDDCIVAIWDMETLAVTASIMDADDYKNLSCSIQPKGGLIAVGGLSDIKVRPTTCARFRVIDMQFPCSPDLQLEGVCCNANRSECTRHQARCSRDCLVVRGEAASRLHVQGFKGQRRASLFCELVTTSAKEVAGLFEVNLFEVQRQGSYAQGHRRRVLACRPLHEKRAGSLFVKHFP